MSDIYLKIAEVDGDVTDSNYVKHVQVQSMSTGMSNPSSVSVGTQAGSAGGGGKVIMQDIHFTKYCDKASPKLWLKCAKGEHFKDFEFKYVISRGESSDVFKTVKLTDVLVTGFQHSGSSGSDLPMESKARWDAGGKELYGQKVVGTGPFEFIERKVGAHVLYKRVENHWRELKVTPTPSGYW